MSEGEAPAASERRETGQPPPVHVPEQPPGEIGGPRGPEPTRFGDWEKGGRWSDF